MCQRGHASKEFAWHGTIAGAAALQPLQMMLTTACEVLGVMFLLSEVWISRYTRWSSNGQVLWQISSQTRVVALVHAALRERVHGTANFPIKLSLGRVHDGEFGSFGLLPRAIHAPEQDLHAH